jgi:YbbR domain-containing protein
MARQKTVDVILAIICAFALWAYVTMYVNPPDTKVIEGVRVELLNLEALQADNRTVAAGSFVVGVTIEGPRSDVNSFQADDFKATADMSNFPLGVNQVGVKVTGPDSVTIKEVHPERIEIEVEELVAVSKPVMLSYSDEFPAGMEPGFISITLNEIEVTGAKSEVDRVSYVRAEINSAQLRESERTLNVSVTPVDKAGDSVYNVALSQDSVDVAMRLCYVKEVPLDIEITGNPPGALAVTKKEVPDKVFIRGSKEAIERIDRVTGVPIDIGNLRSTTIITPQLNLPDTVELADASKDIAVTIEIGGEEAKSFSVTSDMIEVRGVPDGYSAHIVTGSISATIFGSHEQLANFSPENLDLFIDLSTHNMTQGQIKVLIGYEKTDAVKRIDLSPIAVDVRITEIVGSGVPPENAPPPEVESGDASLTDGDGETASGQE